MVAPAEELRFRSGPAVEEEARATTCCRVLAGEEEVAARSCVAH